MKHNVETTFNALYLHRGRSHTSRNYHGTAGSLDLFLFLRKRPTNQVLKMVFNL